MAITAGASGVLDFETVPFQNCMEPSRLFTALYLAPSTVKDGLAVVEQSKNAGIPRLPALHLHCVCPA